MKIQYVEIIVQLQEHTKEFLYIMLYEEKSFAVYFGKGTLF